MEISTRFIVGICFLFYLSQTAWSYRVTDYVGDTYQNGSHQVNTTKIKRIKQICCPLWVAFPVDAARYPVVQFQHGTQLSNTDYSALITQVASWGFIVVAPQMYRVVSLNATKEITNARAILNWMRTGLQALLPSTYAHYQPDFSKVALAGHSRGGLVVFGLALNYGNAAQQQYAAIVGLDPVDASGRLSPTILKPNKTLDIDVPTLIVGTGMGSKKPVCAPANRSHIEFYQEMPPPSFHFVATEQGHMDFTDDCKWWDINFRCKFPCRHGKKPRQFMRQFAAGIMVAFLQDALMHNNASLSAAFTNYKRAPVVLATPESKPKQPSPTSAPLLSAKLR